MVTSWFDKLREFVGGGPAGPARGDGTRLRSEVVRLYGEGRLPEATEAARQLVDWQRHSLGEKHPDFARGLSNLAMLLQKMGDDRQAADFVNRVVAIRREALGPGHPETAEAEDFLRSLGGSGQPLPSESGPPGQADRVDAVAVIERVIALEHVGPGDPAALRDCREAAFALRSEIENGGNAAAARMLTDGSHPFAALLALAGPGEALSDARWADFHESVRDAFGLPLAQAASRGRLLARPPA